MDPPKQKRGKGPEAIIQQAIINLLRQKGWYVKVMVGGTYMYGIPDLYATHCVYGPRWIEVKNPTRWSFTAAQKVEFPKLQRNGTKIWILVAATEAEYLKLFKEPNMNKYFMQKGFNSKGHKG